MKRFIFAFTLSLITITPTAAKHKFDGPYAGAVLGYAQNKFKTSNKIILQDGRTVMQAFPYSSTSGSILGAVGGWQIVFRNRYLLGIEATADKVDAKGKVDFSSFAGSVNTKFQMGPTSVGANVKAGMVFMDSAIYGAIGFLTAQMGFVPDKVTFQAGVPGSQVRTVKDPKPIRWKTALHYKVGAQTSVTDKMIGGFEVSYARFGRVKLFTNESDPGGFGTVNTVFKFLPIMLDVKLKVSYTI